VGRFAARSAAGGRRIDDLSNVNAPTITTRQNCNAGPAPAVTCDRSLPASTDGTKTWSYTTTDGVARYGTSPDFLRDSACGTGRRPDS
jgi:hypothetical protein